MICVTPTRCVGSDQLLTLGAVYLGMSIAGFPFLARLAAVAAGGYLMTGEAPPQPAPQGAPPGPRPITSYDALVRFRRGQFRLQPRGGTRSGRGAITMGGGCGCGTGCGRWR